MYVFFCILIFFSSLGYQARIWHLSTTGIRGKPKTINILETVKNITDTPFVSVRSPLQIYLPSSARAGSPLDVFGVHLAVGLTRSLACKLLLFLVWHAKLSDEEIRSILPQIKGALFIKVTLETYESEEDMVQRTIVSSMVVAESTRPDIFALYYSFSNLIAKAGQSFFAEIDSKVDAFNNQSSVESFRVSESERKMIKLLPAQEKAFVDLLDGHWNAFKAAESAIPLRQLVTNVDRAKAKDGSITQTWQGIFGCSPQKNRLWLQRQINVFLKNLKAAMANNKGRISLSFRSVFCLQN